MLVVVHCGVSLEQGDDFAYLQITLDVTGVDEQSTEPKTWIHIALRLSLR